MPNGWQALAAFCPARKFRLTYRSDPDITEPDL
jgi:hypothetical protein